MKATVTGTRAAQTIAPTLKAAGPVLQRACACGKHTTDQNGECTECRKKRLGLQRRAVGQGPDVAPPIVHDVLRSAGRPLDDATRGFMESRFNHDFSGVRVHTDGRAAESARAVNALAYTVGNHIAFDDGNYSPGSTSGQRLLAHELSHTLQQRGMVQVSQSIPVASARTFHEYTAERASEAATQGHVVTDLIALNTRPQLQRTIGDGHDLASPRFRLLEELEAAYDGERLIQQGSKGRGVQAIQQALYDLGYPLPGYGADGNFGSETKRAVLAFQRANTPLLNDDGQVGKETMRLLDARFATPTLPMAATLTAPWTATCVRSILCPWSPHTIDVLRTRITLKSFDRIWWDDEQWNGSAWVVHPFEGGGYQDRAANEIGVLNSPCQDMAQTLYHEVLHAEQPTSHTTTLQSESYAYRIGEEFSIAMGLPGQPSLRSTDARGRELADPAKVSAFVQSEYPSVPATGSGDQIIGKAATPGHVDVRRPNGSVYSRPAAVGEKVSGPMHISNETLHARSIWTCP